MKKYLKLFLTNYILLYALASIPAAILWIVTTGILQEGSIFLGWLSLAAFVVLFLYFQRNKLTEEHFRFHGILLCAMLSITAIILAIGAIFKNSTFAMNLAYPAFPFYILLILTFFITNPFEAIPFVIGSLVITFLAVSVLMKKIKEAKLYLIVALVLCLSCGVLYSRQPFVLYKGHGFAYMNGFSSTDFTGYHVYDNKKLATLDHPASLQITDVEDMPVLDGAEACYPLYAAIAKAIYKDIDVIEKQALKDPVYHNTNGRIVQFTNTVVGYNHLASHKVDIFIGAGPTEDQIVFTKEFAKDEITTLPIGKEAFVFFVEEDNPINGLTSEQIRLIYHGDITNWQELGGKNQEIIAFQRPRNSGSQAAMIWFMKDVSLKEPLSYENVDAMMGVISEVAQYNNEKGAMGYTFRYFLEGLSQEKGVKMLAVDGVYPSLETIKSGEYPLTVPLVAATLSRTSQRKKSVQQVLDFLLSPDGQELIEKTGYAPLNN